MIGSCTLIRLACFSLAWNDPIAIEIEPYLQWPTRDAITVMWETNEPTAGEIRYGTTPELDKRAVEPEPRRVHELRLTDLLPRTRYYYRVACGDVMSDRFTFRTPPLPGEPWRTVVYGDSRSFPDRHRRAVELAEQFEPDLIVHTGDQVTRGTDRPMWKAQFFDPAARLFAKVPVITSLGNHEENAGNYFEYFSLPGNERYFSVDFGDLHLVILDSNVWGKPALESEQLEWLRGDLARPRSANWTAVAFHHPLFSAHDKRAINPARWTHCPTFEELGVDLVLTGHDHFYYRSWPIGRLGAQSSRGLTHITTAGGGAPLYRMKPRSYTAVEEPVHHVTVLDFDGDIVRGRAIDVAGNTIDQYEIRKGPTPPDQFCAYEVYELERSIRTAIERKPPINVAVHQHDATVNEQLQVDHSFRVPVAARLRWDDAPTTDNSGHVDLKLVPGEPLSIPVNRQVSLEHLARRNDAKPESRLPHLMLSFADERFRNRDIEFSPLKFWQELTVHSKPLRALPSQAAVLDGNAPGMTDPISLVCADGSRPAQVTAQFRIGHAADRLVALITISDAQTTATGDVTAQPHTPATDILKAQHVRLVVSDGKHTYGFAVSLDGHRASQLDDKWASNEPDWSADIRRVDRACSIALTLPRQLPGLGELSRINLVHVDSGRDIESCLSPTFDPATDPDRIPDYRFGDRSISRFAQLLFDE